MESWLTNWCAKGSAANRAEIAGVLPRDFYRRRTIDVAVDLLGKVLVVRSEPSRDMTDPRALVTAGRIVETEAYWGTDPASHCSRGETERCSVMFGDAGVAYVYFIYGMYEMLNFVTEPARKPGAVLIRALEPVDGEPLMRRRRQVKNRLDLTRGPGRLCRAMGIKMSHNGRALTGPELFVVDDGYQAKSVSVSERVGISVGLERPWRFFLTDNPFVSRVPQNQQSFALKRKSELRRLAEM